MFSRCSRVLTDDVLAYTTARGDVVQLTVETNETSVIIDNATLVSIYYTTTTILLKFL